MLMYQIFLKNSSASIIRIVPTLIGCINNLNISIDYDSNFLNLLTYLMCNSRFRISINFRLNNYLIYIILLQMLK